MSTYTLYYQSPVVHTPTPYAIPSAPLYPIVQSQSRQPRVQRKPSISTPRSTPPTSQRKSVSTSTRSGPISISPQTQSSFFRLPAELRNEIYRHLLCPNALSSAELARQTKDLSVRGFNQTATSVNLFPAILSTCRRIHDEAEALLYSTSIFHAHPALLTSLPHLQSPSKPVLYPGVTSKIRRWQISLRLDTDPRFSLEQAAKAFSGAEYLEIRVWQAQFEACDWSVLKLFTGIRGVQIARVGGSVDVELARRLEEVMMQPEQGERTCTCVVDEEMFWGKREELCGHCYRKSGFE